jgi:hypothetical protein
MDPLLYAREYDVDKVDSEKALERAKALARAVNALEFPLVA